MQVKHCWYTEKDEKCYDKGSTTASSLTTQQKGSNNPNCDMYYKCFDTYEATFDASSLSLIGLKSEKETIQRNTYYCGEGCGCDQDMIGVPGGQGQGCVGDVIRYASTAKCWSAKNIQSMGDKKSFYNCPNDSCIKIVDPATALAMSVRVTRLKWVVGLVFSSVSMFLFLMCCAAAVLGKISRSKRGSTTNFSV